MMEITPLIPINICRNFGVVDGINNVDRRYIYQLMSTVQIPGPNIFDSQIQMHTGNQKYDVSLAKEFQHYLTKEHCKNGVIDQGKLNKTIYGNKMDRQTVSCSG